VHLVSDIADEEHFFNFGQSLLLYKMAANLTEKFAALLPFSKTLGQQDLKFLQTFRSISRGLIW
jgi:hypothetical protein